MKAVPLALLAGLSLSACGFVPARPLSLPTPLQKLHLQVESPYRVGEPPVALALRQRLQRAGGDILAKAEQTPYQLKLWDLREERQPLSLGPDGKALEYRLRLSLRYQLSSGANALVAPSEISVSRDFGFRADQILAKEAEEAQLSASMQDEMAELLLLRLRAQIPATP